MLKYSSKVSACRQILYTSLAIIANLEGPEEEHEGEIPSVRDCIPGLSGNA
jgi:hypothetical protein